MTMSRILKQPLHFILPIFQICFALSPSLASGIQIFSPLKPLSVVNYSFQSQKTNPSVESAEAIVKKSIAAYGGEAKISSLKNATYLYGVETLGDPNSKPVQVKTYFKDESLFRSEVRSEKTDAITILNGDNGWVKVGGTTLSLARKSLDPMKTTMISQLRPELLLLVFQKFRYSGRTEEGDQKLDQVEISGFIGGEYIRGRLSFDLETSLIYKYEYEIERELPKGKGIVQGEERYVTYRESDGFKVPVEIVSKQGTKESRIKISQVNFNTPLDERLFEDPTPSEKPAK